MTRTGIVIFALCALPIVAHAQADAGGEPDGCPCGMMGPGMEGMHGGMMGPGMEGMHGGMMGPGMMEPGMDGMHGGMMGLGMMGPLHALDLSEKQRGQVSEIAGKMIKPMWDLSAKMDEERQKLRGLYSTEKVDPKQVGAIVGRMGQLHQQMAELMAQAHNEIMAVLTPEQRQQLVTARRGMWGPGTGGPGKGPPPHR